MGREEQPEISGLELSRGAPILHACYLPGPVVSPEAEPLLPLMLVTKHQATFYMTSCTILTLLLCGMNISPFL